MRTLNEKIAKSIIESNDSLDLIALKFDTTLLRVETVEKELEKYINQ